MRKYSTLLQSAFFILLLLLNVKAYAQEETVYVSDVLYVPLRSGQGNQFRIINKGLKSGTPLIRIEVNEDNTWSKVKTQAGIEGWVPNQYLSEDKTAQIKLNQALARLAIVENELADLKQTHQELLADNQKTRANANESSQTNSSLKKELERIKQVSANAIDLDQRHRELLEKHEVTQTQLNSLEAENDNLKSDKTLSFMFYGAGLLILGMVLSVLLPALKPKKRYSDWA